MPVAVCAFLAVVDVAIASWTAYDGNEEVGQDSATIKGWSTTFSIRKQRRMREREIQSHSQTWL